LAIRISPRSFYISLINRVALDRNPGLSHLYGWR
jgi:hypothetical protein